MRKLSEDMLEMIRDLSPREQAIIYSQTYSCGDADMMDWLDAVGAFQPEGSR